MYGDAEGDFEDDLRWSAGSASLQKVGVHGGDEFVPALPWKQPDIPNFTKGLVLQEGASEMCSFHERAEF